MANGVAFSGGVPHGSFSYVRERGVHRNAVVVALANKLARIAWAVLRKETSFERSYAVMT